jgi:uncharacterized membrane protein YfcA
VLIAALATLVASTLQSATGFGFALVLGPALFAVFDPSEALTTLLILGGALNLLVLFAERRPRQVRRDRLGAVLLWALPGLALGAAILAALSKPTLQIAVGVAVLIAVGVQVRVRGLRASRVHEPNDPLWVTPGVGLTTGVLSTTTGTSGPPLVLWFQHLGFSPAEFRDSLAAAFLALNVVSCGALELFGDGVSNPGTLSIVGLLALAVVGHLTGRQLFERLAPHHFRAIGLALIVAAGLASLAAGVAGS